MKNFEEENLVNVVWYDRITGRIMQTGKCPLDHVALQSIGNSVCIAHPDADPLTNYFAQGKLTARPIAGSVLTGQTISNLPNPSKVTVKGVSVRESYTVTDGVIEFAFTYAGKYTVTVDAFPHVDQTFEIIV